jgi:hypothetical protein
VNHWRWAEPDDGIAIVEFEALTQALTTAVDLPSAIGTLLAYEWLPVEGRDFVVRFDSARTNGVAIESPVFYSTAPA